MKPEEAMAAAAKRVAEKSKPHPHRFSKAYVSNLARCGAKHLLGLESFQSNSLRAFLFFTQAAQFGHPGACYELGVMYATGVPGVCELDAEQASQHFMVAAESGLPSAQYNLAFFYEQGRGVSKNADRAVELWERAAEQGHTKARCMLAERYFRGRATFGDSTFGALEQDYAAAIFYWGLAADDGEPKAIHALAIMHEAGLGVAQSTKLALELYDLAAFAWSQQHPGSSSLPRWFKNAAGRYPKYKKRKFKASKRAPHRLLLKPLNEKHRSQEGRRGTNPEVTKSPTIMRAEDHLSPSPSSTTATSPSHSLLSPSLSRTGVGPPKSVVFGGIEIDDRVHQDGGSRQGQKQSGEQQSKVLANLKRWEESQLQDESPSVFELNFSGRKALPHLDRKVRRRHKGVIRRQIQNKGREGPEEAQCATKSVA